RRDVRAPDRGDGRAVGDPGAQPRRRHPLRPRAAAVRLDRGLGVDARRLRRRGARADRPDGGGRARDGAVAAGQERRESARDDPGGGRAGRESALEAVAQGVKTADLGGETSTSDFTDEVIRRTRTKLEVWSTL